MLPMAVTGHANIPLRCHHCGREVSGTVHKRSSYRVDYYALHTGEVEPVTLVRGDEATRVVTVLKLVRANHIVTCVECYREPEIRAARDALFRPEQQQGHEPPAMRSHA
jgi:hypothetical protein